MNNLLNKFVVSNILFYICSTINEKEMEAMEAITINTLADKLCTSKDALRLWCNRNGLKVSNELTQPQIKEIAQAYSIPNSRRSDEVVKAAKAILASFQVQQTQAVNVVVNNHMAENKTTEKETEKEVKVVAEQPKADISQIWLRVVFGCAIAWQIVHTAILEESVSPVHGIWGWVLAGVFALGVQFTAFMLTLKSNKKVFLVFSSIIELGINILVYFPWVDAAKVLIAVTAAFSIFSYSELIIKK